MTSATQEKFNTNASFTDTLRSPYFVSEYVKATLYENFDLVKPILT